MSRQPAGAGGHRSPRPPADPVVVVGGGLAGLVTALALAPRPCVVLTTGALTEHTSSDLAQGGMAAAVDTDDSPLLHALDTAHAAVGLSEPGVVEAITSAAPQAVAYLAELGVRFDRDAAGALVLGLEGAHSRHRIVHAGGDATGHAAMRAVAAAVRGTDSIQVRQYTRALRILTAEGEVRGVLVESAGRRHLVRTVIHTRRVVLATGGIGGLYLHTTNPPSSRGQGLALAARAGAELRDVEMVQFHPTALDVGLDPMPLVSEAVRGAGARLRTRAGEPLACDDLAPRDVVSRAVAAADGVVLDTTALGPAFLTRFPTVARACLEAGIDPVTQPVPIRPAAHYHMGGVRVDRDGRTTVPGLWAVGEVASTGLHGANRLASNSLLEAVVCAGWVAADIAGSASPPRQPVSSGSLPEDSVPAASLSDQELPSVPDGGLTRLRALMSAHVGVVRSGAGLAAAREQLAAVTEAAGPDHIDDATLVALLVTTSALRRLESRGAHLRTDAPRTSEIAEHQILRLSDIAPLSVSEGAR